MEFYEIAYLFGWMVMWVCESVFTVGFTIVG